MLGGGIRPSNETTIARQPGALYVLPTEDEWYKAAFHDAYAGTAGTYFDYAMGTNTVPYSDNPNSLNTPDDTNVANYFNSDGSANGYNDGYAVTGSLSFPSCTTLSCPIPYTPVGAYTLSASPYGTFDQNGNVREWNETFFNFPPGVRQRGVRGGSFFDSALGSGPEEALHKAGNSPADGGGASGMLGFRIASLEVPDPIDYILTVEYQTPEVTGPLIEGFDPLPPTITATFRLRDVIPGASLIGLGQVASFDLEIPGNNPTVSDLDSFQLALNSNGTPQSLLWGADDICTGDNLCGVDLWS